MRKLWQISLENQNHQLFYDVTLNYSPYAEAISRNLFSESLGQDETVIAVNPYFSHEKIFGHLLHREPTDTFMQYICDMLLQHIGEIDSISGMTRDEFYVRFLCEDIADGALGKDALFALFDVREQRDIARQYLKLTRTMEYTFCFTTVVQIIFKKSSVLERKDGSIVIYLREKQEDNKKQKIVFLIHVFLEVYRKYYIFWDYPPYIIDSAITIGNFVVF